jgi:hypothetical protein
LGVETSKIREHSVIVFGYGVYEKNRVHRKIVTAVASEDCKYPVAVKTEKLISYLKVASGCHHGLRAECLKVGALNDLKPSGVYVHGISFHMTATGDVLFFDNKNDKVKLATAEEVSKSIRGVWAAYEFKIDV